MASFHVTVSDSVFPNLDPARQVLATIGAELRMADSPTPEGIVDAALPGKPARQRLQAFFCPAVNRTLVGGVMDLAVALFTPGRAWVLRSSRSVKHTPGQKLCLMMPTLRSTLPSVCGV